MPMINLLPWREDRRLRKNKEFISILMGCAILGLLATFIVWRYLDHELEQQNIANEYIITENGYLDEQLVEIKTLEQRRDDIISRITVIQSLQGTRSLPVRVWDDVATSIPTAMYINTFAREGELLLFTGKADNPNVVSHLIRNLDASQWMGDSKVKFIKQNVDAYQPEPVLNQNNDINSAVTPEDRYIDFVVTTQVSMLSGISENVGETAL